MTSHRRAVCGKKLGDRELVRILTDSASRNRITGKEITVGLFSRMHDIAVPASYLLFILSYYLLSVLIPFRPTTPWYSYPPPCYAPAAGGSSDTERIREIQNILLYLFNNNNKINNLIYIKINIIIYIIRLNIK